MLACRKVSDGTRTRDRLDHNQELYQLSYAHQDRSECTGAQRPNPADRSRVVGGRETMLPPRRL